MWDCFLIYKALTKLFYFILVQSRNFEISLFFFILKYMGHDNKGFINNSKKIINYKKSNKFLIPLYLYYKI